jgi:hypothetical protein
MPPEPIYYTLDVPDDQRQAVQAITDTICQEYRIESAFPLLTNDDLGQEQVINASDLPQFSSLLPDTELLMPRVSQFSHVVVIPLWRINLERAISGEREGAYHLVEPLVERESVNQYLPAEHFCERAEQTGVSAEQARLDVLADAMLEVIKYRDARMFLKSVKDSRLLRDQDDRPVIFTPYGIDEYTLWRWAESEAVKQAEASLYKCVYQPELTIEDIPAEAEPIRLWMRFSGESLVLPRLRQRHR